MDIQIITESAMETGEDSNEFIWAGYLIGGSLFWVEGYDLEVDYFPGHEPLIVCTQAEFSISDTTALPAPYKAVEA